MRAFFVILLLHVVIVGGIMINGWVNQEPPMPMPTVSQDTVPGDAFAERADQPTNSTQSQPAAARTTDDADSAPVNTRREPVRSGDTIASFAARHKADEADVRTLNRIGPNSGIQVGQWLLVPEKTANTELVGNPADEAARTIEVPVAKPVTVPGPDRSPTQVAQQTASRTTTPAATGSDRSHTVQAGETAWGISQKYKVNVNDLLKLNGISDPSTLRIGTELKIP